MPTEETTTERVEAESYVNFRLLPSILNDVKRITGATSRSAAIRALLIATSQAGDNGKIDLARLRSQIENARNLTGG